MIVAAIARSNLLAHIQAIDIGGIEVKDDQIGLAGPMFLEAALAIRRPLHGVTRDRFVNITAYHETEPSDANRHTFQVRTTIPPMSVDASRNRPIDYRPIEEYAIIGDCRSAALISRTGSIDWLSWPRFDSPTIFCALVDNERGGAFSLGPVAACSSTREYLGESAVLCTTFTTPEAEFTLTDAMPIATTEEQRRSLMPEHEIVRVLTCTKGEGAVTARFEPRTGFGQWNDRLNDRGKLGIRIVTRQGLLTLRTDIDLVVDAQGRGAVGVKTLRAGQSVHCSVTWTADAPAILTPLGATIQEKLALTRRAWKVWSSRTTYEGPYAALVRRSAIVVRLLSFAPSGAVIAAATSSLPEVRGGKNNWDYRYCWLRDATFMVHGMLELGHPEEALGFTHWLLHATRLTQPKLKVLYDVYGRPPPKEAVVPGLAAIRVPVPSGPVTAPRNSSSWTPMAK